MWEYASAPHEGVALRRNRNGKRNATQREAADVALRMQRGLSPGSTTAALAAVTAVGPQHRCLPVMHSKNAVSKSMTAHRSIRLGSMSLGTLCRSLVLPLLLLIAQQGAALHGLSHFTWPAEVQLARPLQAEPAAASLSHQGALAEQ